MSALGPDSVLVLWSAPPRVYSTDTNYEYRQESNLLYLTVEQRRELNGRIFELLRDYEPKDPARIPEQAERIATLWSMIPDDRPGTS